MNAPELRSRIDLHDLAARLGMRRPGGKSNYNAPWREDSDPSVSIYTGKDGKERWADKGGNRDHGDAIDLIARVRGLDLSEALKEAHRMFSIPFDTPAKATRPESAHHRIWQNAKSHPSIKQAFDYLLNVRKLPEASLKQWQGKAFGFSDYKPEAPEYGPAMVFPVRDSAGGVVAVNQRYLADGHEPKMRMVGEMTAGGMFYPDLATLKKPVIWLVESPIDALTLTAAGCPAVAFLSANNTDSFPLSWLTEKQRLMILGDADPAGKKAQETLYHRAISAGITPQIVDWPKDYKDPNAALQAGLSLEQVAKAAKKINQGLFPAGAPYLPESEFKRLFLYRCGMDTTESVKLQEVEELSQKEDMDPVAGFRVFRIDPITIHDPATAMGGDAPSEPSPRYLVHYRRADYHRLQRLVLTQEEKGAPATWSRFGHIHNPRTLSRIVDTLSRDQRHAQETVGVIGLVRLGGKVCLVDARNSYLNAGDCIYHRLVISSAPKEKALPILRKLDGLLKDGLGLIWFAWHLGALMKVFLGFWPHLSVSGHSGSGKSTIAINIMAALTGCIHKTPSELETGYRRMKVVASHIYPVIFDEISRANKQNLEDFVDILNYCYMSGHRGQGKDGQYFLCAPVAMIGQDNPVTDAAINAKIISMDIDGTMVVGGDFTPDGPFPVREWAEWLVSRWDSERVKIRIAEHQKALLGLLKANQGDTNIGRFVKNYAALQLVMEELFAFSGYENNIASGTLVRLMNTHLRESEVIRRESVAILDRLAREIALCREQDVPPFKIECGNLIISATVILDFLTKRGHHFPVTSARRLVTHLRTDGFLTESNASRWVDGVKRMCVVLDLKKMDDAGIDWPGWPSVDSL